MKAIILLILFFNIFCRTGKYYTSCQSGAPKSGFLTSSECSEYAQKGSYCCLLYYTVTADIKNSNASNLFKDTKGRILTERENYCFGLTKNGFDNIDDVIDELEDETEIDDIHIICTDSKYLNFRALLFLLLILF